MIHSPEFLEAPKIPPTIPRVGIIGTVCVGKSTVLECLKNTYQRDTRVALLDEVARPFFDAHREITERRSVNVQTLLMNMIIVEELKAECRPNRPEIIVSDRAPICAPVVVASEGNIEAADILHKTLEARAVPYELLLFDVEGVPYNRQVPDFEQVMGKRSRIHEQYKCFMEERAIPYTLVGGTLEERVAQVDSVIQSSLQ
jgi:hypothetical protein